jgi:ABC-type transport system involved in multi-copper enzyme maturation permease subunit
MDRKKMMVLFINTFQKEYRNKMMIFFIILTVILIFGINSILNFAGQLPGIIPRGSLGDKKLFVFFYVINIWNVLLSVIIGINCVKSDLKSGVILQIFSLPIKRAEYLFARILGATGIVLSYYFLAFFLGVVVFAFSSGGGVSFDFKMLLGLLPTAVLILSAVTFSVLFSLFFSKIQSLFAAIISMAFISHYNNVFSLTSPSNYFKDLNIFSFFGLIFHFIFPRVGIFNDLAKNVILGNPLDYNLLMEIPHFLISYAILGLLCHIALKKKEF